MFCPRKLETPPYKVAHNRPKYFFSVQVNLCQKLLFLHQLTHNMTTDCSLFMKIVSSEYLQNMLYTQIVVFVLLWHSEQLWYTTCSADVASFWKRFTCTWNIFASQECWNHPNQVPGGRPVFQSKIAWGIQIFVQKNHSWDDFSTLRTHWYITFKQDFKRIMSAICQWENCQFSP